MKILFIKKTNYPGKGKSLSKIVTIKNITTKNGKN